MTTLTDEDIVRMSQILSGDAVAVAKKENIYGCLGLRLAELQDLKQKVSNEGSGDYGFFSAMLQKYRTEMGSGGTLSSVTDYLTALNITSVVEAITEKVLVKIKSIWFKVDNPVMSFTGRQRELSQLHEKIIGTAGSTTVINQKMISTVSGLGGIGKSELARKYAQEYRQHYGGNVVWVDAELQETFRKSIIKLLKTHFNISEEVSKIKTNEELMETVYEWFGSRNQKCLIIFDNVEEFDVLKLLPKDLDPEYKVPNILITSRRSLWKHGINVFSLDVLSEEEAKAFVNEYIENITDQRAVIQLVGTLQCLPLALQQAVAYIRAELGGNPNPIKKYLQLLESKKEQALLNYKNTEMSYHEKTTFTTWTVTMDKIMAKKSGGLAIQVMNIVSCLEPDRIPGYVFGYLKANRSESNISPTTACYLESDISSSETFAEEAEAAIFLLKNYSMVSGPPGLINVHRVVQRVVRLKIEPIIQKVLHEGLDMMIRFMDAKIQNHYFAHFSLKSSSDYRRLVTDLFPHAESIWRRSMEHRDLIREFALFPSNLCETMRKQYVIYDGMVQLARDSKSRIVEVLGENHEHSIKIKFSEADMLCVTDKYSESLELSKEVYLISKVKLGKEHPITRDASYLFAKNLAILGNYSQEMEMHNERLELELNEFGPEHRFTLAAQHNKAVVSLLHYGRLDESLQLFQNVYEVSKRVLGTDDDFTLNTAGSFADVLMKKGMLEEALEVFNSVFKSKEHRKKGRSHYPVRSWSQLACLLLKEGNSKDALGVDPSVYEKRNSVFPNHQHSLLFFYHRRWSHPIVLQRFSADQLLDVDRQSRN